ncbi:Nicotinate phosphoribosyltransferase pncB2 [subsurface metagenome]|nr:nicotinate phosphoribosyltransferase [Methanosarcinales archaeon]
MEFSIVPDEEILEGKTTDIYFLRAEEVLRRKGVNPEVVAEVITTGGGWAVLTGLEEVAHLLAGKDVDVYAMPEGTIFFPYEPALRIEGRYLEFARYETPLLGLLCHESGIATKAARIKCLAGDVPVISFGTRRQHPALAAMIERCAYLGGMDGVSCVAGAERIGIEATGTMPHSLIICFGEDKQKDAWKAFDEVVAKEVPRICLCDTYYDEKKESIMAAEALGESLRAVRLDTPTSRKGDFRRIIEEVRWELDIRGYKNVGIFVSGGIDEEEVVALKEVVAGFGVGTSVSNAKCIDFALDIIEREGEPCAKRGKRGGKKQVYRRKGVIEEGKDEIRMAKEAPPEDMESLLKPMILKGKIVKDFSFSLEEARKRVLEQLKSVD